MNVDDPRGPIGIVVVNYGSSDLLRQNLAAIDRALLPGSVVVVVDNPTGSDDRTERDAVHELARRHGWTVVDSEANVGFGAGVNAGVEAALEAGCTSLAIVNPDLSIEAGAIAHLDRIARDRPHVLVCPRIVRPDGSSWFAGGQLDRRAGATRTRPDAVPDPGDRWLTGACLVLSTACWQLTGGFDPDYFLYWEDVDLSQRLLARGGDLLVCHDVVAVHDVGATQAPGGKSPVYVFHMCRNRLRFAASHLEPRDRLRWLILAPRYAMWVLTLHGRREALRHPGLGVAAIRGTAAGAALVVGSLRR